MTKNPSSSLVSKSGNGVQISKNLLKLVENIANNSAAKEESKAPQQEQSQQLIDQTLEDKKSSVEQDTEQNEAPLKEDGELGKAEESPAQSVGNEESQDSVKKDEGFIVGMLKALIKMMGGTIDEDGKEEEKNKSNALEELRKFIFGDNSKGKAAESASVILPSDLQNQDQNQDLKDSQTPTQTQDPAQAKNSTPAQAPNSIPTPDQTQAPNSIPTPDQTQALNSTPDEDENNADKLITQLIVGLYEKEGKLDLLKEILKEERGKDENKDNQEMQNLINGFDSQIAEVENNREQAVGKGEKAVENSEEVKNSNENGVADKEKTNGEVEPKVEEGEVKPEDIDVKLTETIVGDKINEFDELGAVVDENVKGTNEAQKDNSKNSHVLDNLKGILDGVVSQLADKGVEGEEVEEGEQPESTKEISEEAAQENKEQGQGRG
jgi:hypothetical protein